MPNKRPANYSVLPPKLPKKPKRSSRWRSSAHRKFVREHACCNCGGTAALEFAHLRMESGAGMGEKPDDWLGTVLCHDCHNDQHTTGEPTFWERYSRNHNQTVWDLIEAFCKASPKANEIRQAKRERELG